MVVLSVVSKVVVVVLVLVFACWFWWAWEWFSQSWAWCLVLAVLLWKSYILPVAGAFKGLQRALKGFIRT